MAAPDIIYAFRQEAPATTPDLETGVITETQEKADPWLFCVNCNHRITRPANGISIHGKHHHRFLNPEGFYFEIRCFNRAPGCLTTGKVTDDFTWFPGYAWQIAVCQVCNIHLGWKYLADDHIFYGLIQDRLLDADHSSADNS